MLNDRTKLNLKTALTLYKSLIRPMMTYVCPVWGYAAKTHIKNLQVIQNKILYMTTKLPRVIPVRTLHRETGMEMIAELFRTAADKFYITCEGHSNPLVAELGSYEIEHIRHKRPRLLTQE